MFQRFTGVEQSLRGPVAQIEVQCFEKMDKPFRCGCTAINTAFGIVPRRVTVLRLLIQVVDGLVFQNACCLFPSRHAVEDCCCTKVSIYPRLQGPFYGIQMQRYRFPLLLQHTRCTCQLGGMFHTLINDGPRTARMGISPATNGVLCTCLKISNSANGFLKQIFFRTNRKKGGQSRQPVPHDIRFSILHLQPVGIIINVRHILIQGVAALTEQQFIPQTPTQFPIQAQCFIQIFRHFRVPVQRHKFGHVADVSSLASIGVDVLFGIGHLRIQCSEHARVACFLICQKKRIETFGAEMGRPVGTPHEIRIVFVFLLTLCGGVVIAGATITFVPSPPHGQIVDIFTPQGRCFEEMLVAAAPAFHEDWRAMIQAVHTVNRTIFSSSGVGGNIAKIIANSHCLLDSGVGKRY